MATLYEIRSELQHALRLAEDGELGPDLEKLIDGISMDFGAKAENILKMRAQFMANAAMAKAEEDRIREIRLREEAKADWLKNYLHANMRAIDLDRIDGVLFKARRQKNPPAVQVADLSALPPQFLTFVPARYDADKRALLAAHKAGEELPTGVTVIVGERLVIQ